MGFEAGKNRLECVGDVEESADLIEYYCVQLEQHDGFQTRLGTLGPNEENASVLRPYGVWAVISPFNFPLALAAGPAGGALVAGNTVVFKPASATPLLGYMLYEVMAGAGIPDGVFNFLTGSGSRGGVPHRQSGRRRHRCSRDQRTSACASFATTRRAPYRAP
jgi:1-pyrroline-5-carboxylate dehydrogenase